MEFIVPGFYAKIEDYQLKPIQTVESLKDDAIVYLGDLPDFVYVPDEKSSDINAVKRVRIVPNTILPITDVETAVKALTGNNILDGILTQAQKEELLCKDMVNVINMSRKVAVQGKLAVVKIVKRDGTRPDVNNKFEVYQALENAYEKLGNVKASQIVPIGISGDEDFVNGEEKEPVLTIDQARENGSVVIEKIYPSIYEFTPVEKFSGIKLELAFSNPEVLNHEGTSAEQQLIKKEGLDSEKVKDLLKGKVLVDGVVKVEDVQLKYLNGAFVSVEETTVSVVDGQVSVVVGAETPFATVSTTVVAGKTVAELDAKKQPLLNYYEAYEIKPEVAQVNLNKVKPKANEEVLVIGKLKESASNFTAKLTGTNVEVLEEISLQEDKVTFQGKIRFTAEGENTVTLTVEEPYVACTKELKATVTGTMEPGPVVKKKLRKDVPMVMSVTTVLASGANQYVLLGVDKPTSSWIEVKNLGNLKETVDKIAVLDGQKNGVEQYVIEKSGTVTIKATKNADGIYELLAEDSEGISEPVVTPVETEELDGNIVLAKTTYITINGATFVLYKGLYISPKEVAPQTVYFDAKSDLLKEATYVINYVPANSEPIMRSLKFVSKQVKSFSEILIVWGIKPAKNSDPATLDKYTKELISLPKFKKGFKVRTSATSEKDYGMFLSTVVGTLKKNGVGGISNFDSYKVIDFEREKGGNGPVKPLTDKLFVELTNEFSVGTNVELKTYVGVKQKSMEAVVLSAKTVLGKTMLTLNKEIDTSIFSLDGFEVIISNIDTKDRHGSYAAAAFAIEANSERDRSPIQKDIDGIADFNFSQENLTALLENKFTVINKNLSNGKAVIVDTPLMTRKDSDYQDRSSIGTVLALLKALRVVANDKKGKRYPKKEDKVLLEDELRNVFVSELNKPDSLITSYKFEADMSQLDSKGYLFVSFKIRDAKKLKVVSFSGGLAKLK